MKNVIWYYRYFMIISGMIVSLQVTGMMWGSLSGINTGFIMRSIFALSKEDVFYLSDVAIRYKFFIPAIAIEIMGHFIFDILMIILSVVWICYWFIKRHNKMNYINQFYLLRRFCKISLGMVAIFIGAFCFCYDADSVQPDRMSLFVMMNMVVIIIITITTVGLLKDFSRLEKHLVT